MFKKIVLIGCLLAVASLAFAQGDSIELMRSDIRTEKVAILTKALAMDQATSDVFWPIYREYETELSKNGDARLANIKDYAANYDSLTDAKTKELVNTAFTLSEDRTKLIKKYYSKVEKATSTKLAARWAQCEMALNSIVDAQIAVEMPLIK
jgi:hypothetical protein